MVFQRSDTDRRLVTASSAALTVHATTPQVLEEQEHTDSGQRRLLSSSAIYLMARAAGAAGVSSSTKGRLAEVYLWSSVLTREKVRAPSSLATPSGRAQGDELRLLPSRVHRSMQGELQGC
jgi:hypothetical protein